MPSRASPCSPLRKPVSPGPPLAAQAGWGAPRPPCELSFLPDSDGASLSAAATNLKAAPSNPLHLTFEFLDVAGQVIATLTQDVPPCSRTKARRSTSR